MYSNYAHLRDERGLTDAQVAEATGIAQQTLSAWKLGQYTPKINKMIIIADFFGVSLDTLCKTDDKEELVK